MGSLEAHRARTAAQGALDVVRPALERVERALEGPDTTEGTRKAAHLVRAVVVADLTGAGAELGNPSAVARIPRLGGALRELAQAVEKARNAVGIHLPEAGTTFALVRDTLSRVALEVEDLEAARGGRMEAKTLEKTEMEALAEFYVLGGIVPIGAIAAQAPAFPPPAAAETPSVSAPNPLGSPVGADWVPPVEADAAPSVPVIVPVVAPGGTGNPDYTDTAAQPQDNSDAVMDELVHTVRASLPGATAQTAAAETAGGTRLVVASLSSGLGLGDFARALEAAGFRRSRFLRGPFETWTRAGTDQLEFRAVGPYIRGAVICVELRGEGLTSSLFDGDGPKGNGISTPSMG